VVTTHTAADGRLLTSIKFHMAAFTHVLEYAGGIFMREIGPSADINVFANCAAAAGSFPAAPQKRAGATLSGRNEPFSCRHPTEHVLLAPALI
jgi:hypothetical protein